MSAQIDSCQIGELDIELALSCPAPLVGKVLQTEFICPHFDTARSARVVAHTNHDGAHFSQRGIALNAHFILGARRVIYREQLGEGCQTLCFLAVAPRLQSGEEVEIHIKHVVIGPYRTAPHFTTVATFGSERERNLVFVEVVFIVRTQTYEQADLAICQIFVAWEGVGMDKKLEVLVATEVELRVFIYRTRIATGEVLHGQREGLLIVFKHLLLSGFDATADARRKHVVDRSFLVVFLKVHRTYHHFARLSTESSGVERLFVVAPFSAHQVECRQTQHDWLVKARHEHAHEADGREIVDASVATLVLVNGDAEEIPLRFGRLAISSLRIDGATIYDIVLSHLHGVRTDLHTILVVFLVFVEGIVLIDILHIGSDFVGCGIAFGRSIGSYRVTIWVVDKLVAIEDAHAAFIKVRTAVIVIAVG